MRYRKKEFWRRLSVLIQTDQRFQNPDVRKGIPNIDDLSRCQSIAVEMGNCLETLGEIAGPVVKLLEEYCESLYQQSIHLDHTEACRMISKKIQKQLSMISRMIQFNLPEGKKEIVFFPYKASMWDSLESIWLAAREDESCEVFVVPIPYFDKNPDGTFGELHDEKNQYPVNVPVIDWQEYSLGERRPDVAYIHNPYDGVNSATSVHPMYYAGEIKRYTDMLVYVPYFVGVNGHVAEHLCVLPGTMYADRVIVESEEVRNIYLEEFRKFERENHCRGKFGNLSQKFLAMGSPKFDRVRSVRRENVIIPEEWKPCMIKENGTWKKVVLYNTTIDSFLNNGETALEKIRHTLSVFENYPDAVLLWRPHPLLKSAVCSIRPELYPELRQIIKEYREKRFGIYDDTADVERAIALSDAYYGDWSSVVTLYQVTGKPIMIQSYRKDE